MSSRQTNRANYSRNSTFTGGRETFQAIHRLLRRAEAGSRATSNQLQPIHKHAIPRRWVVLTSWSIAPYSPGVHWAESTRGSARRGYAGPCKLAGIGAVCKGNYVSFVLHLWYDHVSSTVTVLTPVSYVRAHLPFTKLPPSSNDSGEDGEHFPNVTLLQ